MNPLPVDDITKEEAEEICRQVAEKIIQWQLVTPAILFLESFRPLDVVGAHLYLFFQPLLELLFSFPQGEKFAKLMMKRENVEYFLELLEKMDREHRKA